MSDLLIMEDLDLAVVPDAAEPGDHDRFAHYANKNAITEASVYGIPCVALCGKRWIPSRDPKRYPVCPECKEIFEGLPA